MKKIIILLLLASSTVFGQVNLKYINTVDSLEIRELSTQRQIFQFDTVKGITFPDGTYQNTAGGTGGADSLFHDDTKTWLANGGTIPKADSTRDEFTGGEFRLRNLNTEINQQYTFIGDSIDDTGEEALPYNGHLFKYGADYSLKQENIQYTDGNSSLYGFMFQNEYRLFQSNISEGKQSRFIIDKNKVSLSNSSSSGVSTIVVGDDIQLYQLKNGTSSRIPIVTIDTQNLKINYSSDTVLKVSKDTTFINNELKSNNFFANIGGFFGRLVQVDKVTTDTLELSGVVVDTVIELSEVKYDSLILNPITNSEISHQTGNLHYSDVSEDLVFHNNITDFNWNLGREVPIRFYNNTGETILNGKVVRPNGAYKTPKGDVIFIGALAGKSRLDSMGGCAMVTADVLDGEIGECIVLGQVNGINNENFRNGQPIFIDFAGNVDTVDSDPPLYSQPCGFVVYADNDSGAYYFSGLYEPKYSPRPIFSALFTRESETISNPGLNTFSLITNATNDLFTEDINFGFTLVGDSIQAKQDGLYAVSFSYSFQGDASQNDDWRIGVFVNGVEEYSTQRTSSSTSGGGVPFTKDLDLNINDWVSVRIENTDSGIRTCTFIDGVINITFITAE